MRRRPGYRSSIGRGPCGRYRGQAAWSGDDRPAYTSSRRAAARAVGGFLEEDVPLIQQAAEDPLIPLITTVPTTTDPAAALAFIARQHSRATQGEGYSFAIADASTGAAVGQICLWLRDQQLGTSQHRLLNRRLLPPPRPSRATRSRLSLPGAAGSPELTACSCTSSRGMRAHGAPPSESATSATGCFGVGNASATSGATCTCTRCWPPTTPGSRPLLASDRNH